GSTAQRPAVRARSGKPHPGPDRHRGPRAHPRPAAADRPDRSARAARLRPAPAGRPERERRLVDPRRRSRRGLAGRRAGAVGLVEGSRPAAGVPGRLGGPGCRGGITVMTPGPPVTGDVFGQLAAMRVIPVVVLDDSAAAAPLAGALADAGLPCAEITLRPAAGEAAIALMAQQRNPLVGAGTVLDTGQAERAVEAGARVPRPPGVCQGAGPPRPRAAA